MTVSKIVALDGTAGSGKSTIGRLLADRLRFTFLDSGILYRIIAQKVLLEGISPGDEASVVFLAESLEIDIVGAENSATSLPMICILGREVNQDSLQTAAVDRIVPIVARYPGVRERIRKIQRSVAVRGKIVMAGRDIGTVVLPDANMHPEPGRTA